MNLENLTELTAKRDSRGETLIGQRVALGGGKLISAKQASDIMYNGRLAFMRTIMDEVQASKPAHVQRDEAYELQEEISEWHRKQEEKILAEQLAQNDPGQV